MKISSFTCFSGTPARTTFTVSSTGTLVRTPVADISIVGRNTQGVRLIRLGEGERLTGVERVAALEGDVDGGDDVGAPDDGSSLGESDSDEASPV